MVILPTMYVAGCGVGLLTMLRLLRLLRTVLDFLFWDLVWFALSFCLCFFALVGGAWSNGTEAGLWYWNVNEASSSAWTNIGARLLISFYKYRDLMCLSA